MFSEETGDASPPWGHTCMGQRDSGHLAGSPSARWSGTEPTISRMSKRWVEAVVKPREDGAYVHQHLNFISFWEGPWKKGQGFKPDHGKTGRPAL